MKIELRADDFIRCLTDAFGPRLAETVEIIFQTHNRDGKVERTSVFIEDIQFATIDVRPTALDLLTADHDADLDAIELKYRDVINSQDRMEMRINKWRKGNGLPPLEDDVVKLVLGGEI